MSHTKLCPNWFRRFGVYWLQTNKQTDKQSIYIYRLILHHIFMLITIILFYYLIKYNVIKTEINKNLLDNEKRKLLSDLWWIVLIFFGHMN